MKFISKLKEKYKKYKLEKEKQNIRQNGYIDARKCVSVGNNIFFNNFARRSITGWRTPIPKKGEYILSSMSSGRPYIFKIIKVERCGDPHDMFFADVSDVCYLDQL